MHNAFKNFNRCFLIIVGQEAPVYSFLCLYNLLQTIVATHIDRKCNVYYYTNADERNESVMFLQEPINQIHADLVKFNISKISKISKRETQVFNCESCDSELWDLFIQTIILDTHTLLLKLRNITTLLIQILPPKPE